MWGGPLARAGPPGPPFGRRNQLRRDQAGRGPAAGRGARPTWDYGVVVRIVVTRASPEASSRVLMSWNNIATVTSAAGTLAGTLAFTCQQPTKPGAKPEN